MTDASALASPQALKGNYVGDKHIVDLLIEERARDWKDREVLWPMIKTGLYPMLGYKKAITMADRVGTMGSAECFDWMSGFMNLRVSETGGHAIPATGPVLIVANHPGGIVDGLAIIDIIKKVRKDFAVYANADALRVNPALEDHIIPVEWNESRKGRAGQMTTLRQTARMFNEERAVVLFPSGRLGYLTIKGVRERDWLVSAVSFARKFNYPILPCHVSARMTMLYYFFHNVSEAFRDMTLFHELLKKRDYHYRLTFGDMLDARADLPEEPMVATRMLQRFVEFELPEGARRPR